MAPRSPVETSSRTGRGTPSPGFYRVIRLFFSPLQQGILRNPSYIKGVGAKSSRCGDGEHLSLGSKIPVSPFVPFKLGNE